VPISFPALVSRAARDHAFGVLRLIEYHVQRLALRADEVGPRQGRIAQSRGAGSGGAW